MIPTPLSPLSGPQPQLKAGQVDIEQLQLIDQLSEEMLLTVQAFQRLQTAVAGKYMMRAG
jgi:hypothetical protein